MEHLQLEVYCHKSCLFGLSLDLQKHKHDLLMCWGFFPSNYKGKGEKKTNNQTQFYHYPQKSEHIAMAEVCDALRM